MIKMKIAVPNKGLLSEPALELLRKASFAALQRPNGALRSGCEDGRVEYIFVRAQDVPAYVQSGAAYAGITGHDMVREMVLDSPGAKGQDGVRQIADLGFGRCEVALAVPQNSGITSIAKLDGKRIATKLPNIAGTYLQQKGVDAKLVVLYGAIEIAPSEGLAEAIIDQVQTGRTLKANGLIQVDTIASSSARMIATKNVDRMDCESEEVLKEIELSISGVMRAEGRRYLVVNAPSDGALNKVLSELPSMESPTVLKLAKEGEWAVQTVIKAAEVATTIRNVKLAGGKDILVMPLDKVIE